MQEKTTFDQWALVELMGHQRIAGRVTEAEIGGCKFVRVDVPEIGKMPALTKYLGPASIYGITPVSMETALTLAQQIEAAPINVWDARRLAERMTKPAQQELTAGDDDEDEEAEDEHSTRTVNFL